MTLYELLIAKQKKRQPFSKTADYAYFAKNRGHLGKFPRFASLADTGDEFDIIRLNIILAGYKNKVMMEEEIHSINRYIEEGQKVDHIKLINRLSYLSERVLDSTIYLTICVKGEYCESFCQFSDLLQFFFKILFLPFLGQISTIIKLMQGDHRDTTLQSSNFQYMFDHRRDAIEEINQDIRVEEIMFILHRCT